MQILFGNGSGVTVDALCKNVTNADALLSSSAMSMVARMLIWLSKAKNVYICFYFLSQKYMYVLVNVAVVGCIG